MPTRLRWATTELQIVPIRGSNRHTEAITLGEYILLHMVLVD